MSRKSVIWVVAAILVAGGIFGWIRVRKAREAKQVSFDTTPVGKGRVVAKVTATGTLSAIVTVQVGSQVSGTIAKLGADFNSQVKKGQLVAKIDPALFDAAVQQSRANLVAAQGNLSKVKAQAVDSDRQAARNKELLARKLIAQADYDTAQATADANRAAVEAAAGSVEQARAQLHQAEVNLNYTDIRSPTDGTVISRNVDVGQTVAASLQAPVLFLIAQDLEKMQVDTSVAEADIGKIRPGTTATFSVDAYPTDRFTGTVRQVRNSPQTVQNVVTYDAVIDVNNAELKLKPGMTANCTFVWAEKQDVLRVPNSAMRFVPPPDILARLNPGAQAPQAGRASGGGAAAGPSAGSPPAAAASGGPAAGGGAPGARPGREAGAGRGPRTGGGEGGGQARRGSAGPPDRKGVWVLRDGKPVPVSIRTGVSDGSQTEVLEGELKEGDLVITDISVGAAARSGQAATGAAGNFPRRMF